VRSRTAADRVPKDDIEEMRVTALADPEGLLQGLSDQEVRDCSRTASGNANEEVVLPLSWRLDYPSFGRGELLDTSTSKTDRSQMLP